jgi:hypothetical protein
MQLSSVAREEGRCPEPPAPRDREITACTPYEKVPGREITATTNATNTTTLPARKLTTITKSTNASHP